MRYLALMNNFQPVLALMLVFNLQLSFVSVIALILIELILPILLLVTHLKGVL